MPNRLGQGFVAAEPEEDLDDEAVFTADHYGVELSGGDRS